MSIAWTPTVRKRTAGMKDSPPTNGSVNFSRWNKNGQKRKTNTNEKRTETKELFRQGLLQERYAGMGVGDSTHQNRYHYTCSNKHTLLTIYVSVSTCAFVYVRWLIRGKETISK